jgi:ankyrin repeat protein
MTIRKIASELAIFAGLFLCASAHAVGPQACQYSKDGLNSWVAMIQRQLNNHDKGNSATLGKIAADIIYGDEVSFAKDVVGTDPNMQLKLAGGNMSLLDLAVASCQRGIAKALISKGASADGDASSTPLVTAAAKGDVEMIKYLIERGARTDKTDLNGHAALEEAVRLRKIDATKLLLSYGASPNKKLPNGGTILDLVAYSAEPDAQAVADVLRKSGATSGLSERQPPK